MGYPKYVRAIHVTTQHFFSLKRMTQTITPLQASRDASSGLLPMHRANKGGLDYYVLIYIYI